MNDDQLPINAEQASAYLDGELEADERALVAADAEAMAMVESFTQVRTVLGTVAPVVDSTRTAAMAAALAEFDAMRTAPPTTGSVREPAARVNSLQARRQRNQRLLTGAAAAAVVGVLGIAALNAGRGDDSTSSGAASEATAGDIAATRAAPSPAAADTADTASAGVGGQADAGLADVPEIDSAEGLAQYATDLEQRMSTDASTTAAPSLAATEIAAPASLHVQPACLGAAGYLWLGDITVRGTAAFAVRDATGMLLAIAVDDCRTLLPAP